MPDCSSPSTLKIWLIAGEDSGDALGAGIMRALREEYSGRALQFGGLGGDQMQQEGLDSLFPLQDIAVMGITAVLARLPRILRRVQDCVASVLEAEPDILILIDSPDFTHAVAKRVHRQRPDLTIVNYVSPSVWAWRPGRAKTMRRYITHVLALLPFEPKVHERLGGPPCTYIGHPLIQQLDTLRPSSPRLPLSPELEHFPIKWIPVERKEMRKNKNLERRSESIRSETL
jgi:lipid-A-disaccharide synthase